MTQHHSVFDSSRLNGLRSTTIKDLLQGYDPLSLEELVKLRSKIYSKGLMYVIDALGRGKGGEYDCAPFRPASGVQEYVLTMGEDDPFEGHVRFRKTNSVDMIIDISPQSLLRILEPSSLGAKELSLHEKQGYDSRLADYVPIITWWKEAIAALPVQEASTYPILMTREPRWDLREACFAQPFLFDTLERGTRSGELARPPVSLSRGPDPSQDLINLLNANIYDVARIRLQTLVSARIGELRSAINQSPEIKQEIHTKKTIEKTEDVLRILARIQEFKSAIDSLVGGISKDTLEGPTIQEFRHQSYLISRDSSRFATVLTKHYVTAKKKR